MIKPVNEYIVLKEDDDKKKVGKLIIVSENEKKKANIGIVLAVSKFKDETLSINVGDKVIYRDYAVNEYIEGNDKYLLVQAEDILAVIE